MNPEEARKLLEAATPGPWLCVGEDDEYPRVARVGYMDITNDAEHYNARLITAAPDLAELVAGLRYEYAAQVRRGPASPWLYITRNGCFSRRESISGWYTHRAVCATAIRYALRHNDVDTEIVESRVVRRLVSEPEVAE